MKCQLSILFLIIIFIRNSTSTELLRVLTSQYKPFMYRDENGQLYKGIEYKLLETIAEKEHLQLSFEIVDRSHFADIEHLRMKY